MHKEEQYHDQALVERDAQIAHLNHLLSQRDIQIRAIYNSRSWRMTRPWRVVGHQVLRVRRVWRLANVASQRYGGWMPAVSLAVRLFGREGFTGVRRALAFVQQSHAPVPVAGDVPGDMPLPGHAGTSQVLDYAEWVRRYSTLDDVTRHAMQEKMGNFKRRPLISVLMPVYNTPPEFLQQAIDSVRRQLYPDWELCIADDASTHPAVREVLALASSLDSRIKVIYRDQNGHISHASNSALDLAQGEFLALFDHDDMLAEDALYWMAEAIERHPDAGLLYSDEDKITEVNERYDPYFKSQLNYELLLAQNMICHLGVYRTALVRRLGGFRVGFEGGQDYDLALRVIEQLDAAQVVHVPHVLYHWRAIVGSTALAAGEKNYAAEAGRRAVVDHLARIGARAQVLPAPEAPALNRVRYACPSPEPLVSIIIPTKDRADLLGMCLDTLIERTTYRNYEVIIVDNGSVEPQTQALFARLPAEHFRILRDDSPFNFSALNNHAARIARGSYLCLMNNDIEILTPDWLEEMVSFAARSDVGCVGARLWYPDGRLQHGGCIVGIGGIAGHAHKYFHKGHAGYFGRAVLHQSFSAVTAACLLLRREIFEQVGGLDEKLVVAFNDVDFCLRVQAAGYRNVWTPYAEMTHHESASRGEENTPATVARCGSEIAYVMARWGHSLAQDPAYSFNLSLEREDFSYAWPPRVPAF